jgi:hypothetical protein
VLAKAGSVWQYYQLIDTQWPTSPKTPPASWDSGLAQAVANEPGGQPTPVFLTNVTMETYFQGGNQPACNQEEAVSDSANCPPSYDSVTPGTQINAYTPSPVFWNSALNNGSAPVKPGVSTQILATESCMGCHSSAGIYTSYDPKTGKKTKSGRLTGDFSWLLTQKAQQQDILRHSAGGASPRSVPAPTCLFARSRQPVPAFERAGCRSAY